MRQATVAQTVRLDPVWDRIRDEAAEIAHKEPALGGFIFASVLNHDSFEKALVHRLAQRMGNADIGADLIVQAFDDAIEPRRGVSKRPQVSGERRGAAERREDQVCRGVVTDGDGGLTQVRKW